MKIISLTIYVDFWLRGLWAASDILYQLCMLSVPTTRPQLASSNYTSLWSWTQCPLIQSIYPFH